MELSAQGLPRPESQALARPPFTRDSSAGLTWLWQNPVLLIIGLGAALPYQLQLGATHSAPGHHPRGPFHLQGLQWSISVRFYPLMLLISIAWTVHLQDSEFGLHHICKSPSQWHRGQGWFRSLGGVCAPGARILWPYWAPAPVPLSFSPQPPPELSF